jgi:sirohydrochlorin cobaltochelatase
MQDSPAPTVVVVAHGSRSEAANDFHRSFCESIAVSTDLTVSAAFLESGSPSLPDAVDAAAASGAQSIAVVPHFLAPGNHTTRDIPEMVESARRTHPALEIVELSFTGETTGLTELIGQAVAEQLDGPS